jgi:hypothetical protein
MNREGQGIEREGIGGRRDDEHVAALGQGFEVFLARSGLGVDDHVLIITREPSRLPLIDHPERELSSLGPARGTPVRVTVDEKGVLVLLEERG